MPERQPSSIARVIAVGGVIVMFVAVIAVIAISAGTSSSDEGGDDTPTITSERSNDPDIRKALETGEYRVKEGDTLTAISEATGIDVDDLIQLNPTTDPQALIAGRFIKLR